MPVSIVPDLSGDFSQLEQNVIDHVTAKTTETKSHVTTKATDTKNTLSSKVDTETTEIDNVLSQMGTGEDLNANTTSVNNHTSTKTGEVISQLASDRDNIKAELIRTTAGSLYKLIYDAVANGKSNQQVYDKITIALDSHRDKINGTANYDLTTLKAALLTDINAARDSIKAGYTLASIFNEINTERGVIVNAINAKSTAPIKSIQRGQLYAQSVNASSYFDIAVSSVNTAKSMLNVVYFEQSINSWSNRYKLYPFLYSGTKIRIQNQYGGSNYVSLSWELVEYV